eukprot:TRINITY_DN6693_c0_g2_i1.p1 TRINITY_DN6693_c0_g2~~TRINITY_DN6693_c0_g2_i1.p1  ORF type:complete len:206 (+),score=-20.83 TRINITY_DN6693_c0_g2_i1:90-620(+)
MKMHNTYLTGHQIDMKLYPIYILQNIQNSSNIQNSFNISHTFHAPQHFNNLARNLQHQIQMINFSSLPTLHICLQKTHQNKRNNGFVTYSYHFCNQLLQSFIQQKNNISQREHQIYLYVMKLIATISSNWPNVHATNNFTNLRSTILYAFSKQASQSKHRTILEGQKHTQSRQEKN